MCAYRRCIEIAADGDLAGLMEALAGLGAKERQSAVSSVLEWLWLADRHWRSECVLPLVRIPPMERRLETFRRLAELGFFCKELMNTLAGHDHVFMAALARSPSFDGRLHYYSTRAGLVVKETYSEFIAGEERARAREADAERLLAGLEAPAFARECLAGVGDAATFLTTGMRPGPMWVSPARRAAQLGKPELAVEMLARAYRSGCPPARRSELGSELRRIAEDAMQEILCNDRPQPAASHLDLFALAVKELDAKVLAELLGHAVDSLPNKPSQLVEALVAAPQFDGYVRWEEWNSADAELVPCKMPYRVCIELRGKGRLLETWSAPRQAWCAAVAAGTRRRAGK